MTAWITANPFASMLLLAAALVLLRWGVMSAWDAIEVEECDHSECERPQHGDTVIEIFEHKQSTGDGVESGV